jgi:putative flavoprotein involved in K+ transport
MRFAPERSLALMNMNMDLDVAVIGGGQSALAVGFNLRRTGLRFALFDDQPSPGGAWLHTWPSLRLFSPAQWSSLPGWLMPRDVSAEGDAYPSRGAVIEYLTEYERRYQLPVERPVEVRGVRREGAGFLVETSTGIVSARAIVSATGSWGNPVMPVLPGQGEFRGIIRHSAHYEGPEAYAGKRVIVVGGGNSGAQILAELSRTASVTWATREPPVFLPDEVDGRYLFEQETARYKAIQEGRKPDPPFGLGDIVMVPSVRDARDRGVLVATPMFSDFTADGVVWSDGRSEHVDAVIFATGFRAALEHLRPLGIVGPDDRVRTRPEGAGTRADAEPHVWLVGYGDWTGFASATLIGVGRSARATVDELVRSFGAGRKEAM